MEISQKHDKYCQKINTNLNYFFFPTTNALIKQRQQQTNTNFKHDKQ